MRHIKTKAVRGLAVIATFALLAGCNKKIAATHPPPPPAPAAETAPVTAQASQPAATSVAEIGSTRTPDAVTKMRIQDLLNQIQDIYFDYDKHSLRPDAVATLQADVKTLREILRDYPEYKLTIQGYCDERGSDEYNLALGDSRAKKAEDFLVTLGMPADQLRTISYGKERPVCTEHSESCWQKNRRAHITQDQSS
jgi:peptidoglycan-associated lipoprotein